QTMRSVAGSRQVPCNVALLTSTPSITPPRHGPPCGPSLVRSASGLLAVGLLIGPVATVLTGRLVVTVQHRSWRSWISGRALIVSPQGLRKHTRDLTQPCPVLARRPRRPTASRPAA